MAQKIPPGFPGVKFHPIYRSYNSVHKNRGLPWDPIGKQAHGILHSLTATLKTVLGRPCLPFLGRFWAYFQGQTISFREGRLGGGFKDLYIYIYGSPPPRAYLEGGECITYQVWC